jgi:uncharacterized protein YidB (DUF937 family)
MSLLNEAINAALRQHDVGQVGVAGTSSLAEPLADAFRSLLAPKAAQAGLAPDDTHVEPDALQELISRLEHAGYREIIGSWIGDGGNEPIEPQQIAAALGPRATDLSRDSRLPREALLQGLARLLPAVIDRITPHGKLPQTVVAPTAPVSCSPSRATANTR